MIESNNSHIFGSVEALVIRPAGRWEIGRLGATRNNDGVGRTGCNCIRFIATAPAYEGRETELRTVAIERGDKPVSAAVVALIIGTIGCRKIRGFGIPADNCHSIASQHYVVRLVVVVSSQESAVYQITAGWIESQHKRIFFPVMIRIVRPIGRGEIGRFSIATRHRSPVVVHRNAGAVIILASSYVRGIKQCTATAIQLYHKRIFFPIVCPIVCTAGRWKIRRLCAAHQVQIAAVVLGHRARLVSLTSTDERGKNQTATISIEFQHKNIIVTIVRLVVCTTGCRKVGVLRTTSDNSIAIVVYQNCLALIGGIRANKGAVHQWIDQNGHIW